MKRAILKSTYFLLLPAFLLISGCISKKVLKEGEYLLKKQKIKGNKEISDWTLEELYKQEPNRDMLGLGIRPYLWAYHYGSKIYDSAEVRQDMRKVRRKYDKKLKKHQDDSVKIQKLKRRRHRKLQKLETKLEEGNWLMRSVGEKPAIYDSAAASKTKQQMEIYLQSKGYFNSDVKLITDTNKHYIAATYKIRENKPYTIRNVEYETRDPEIRKLITEHKGKKEIYSGMKYDEDKLSAERDRLYNLLKNNGYYEFSRQYTFFEVDTTLGNREMNLNIVIKNPEKSRHKVYTVKNVYFNTNLNKGENKDTVTYKGIHFIGAPKKLSNKILHEKLLLRPNMKYDLQNTHLTQRRLANLDYFKFINIYYQKNYDDTSKTLTAYVKTSPMKKYQITDEWGVNVSTRGQNLPGPFGSISFKNRNVFGGFETFETSINGGIESVSAATENQTLQSRELGANMRLTFPILLIPANMRYDLRTLRPETSLNLGYNYVDRPEFSRQNVNTSIQYTWQKKEYTRYNITPLDLSIVNTTDLSNSFESYLNNLRAQGNNLKLSFDRSIVTSFIVSRTFNNYRLKARNTTRYLKVHAESGGSITSLINNAFLQGERGTFMGLQNFRFLKFFGDLRYYKPVNKKSTLAFRFNSGIAIPYTPSKALPYEKYFFSGGSNSVRAWKPRRLGPGAYSPPLKDNGTFDYRFEQPGELLLETNLEYRFNMVSFLDGAVFMDAGNVWTIQKDPARSQAHISSDFYKQIALGTGFGIRFDFSFLILRFDLGYKIWDPARPLKQRFVGDHGPFSKTNPLIFNLGIGYPY